MPDRVIRDELLRSERYWSVSIEAQRLFLHILLNVDDTARFSGKNYTLRSACYPGQAIDPEKVERLLAELVDVDLVRVYALVDERFIFVPRFKQRLRFTRSRYPEPPSEINDIVIEKTVSRQTQDGLETGSSPQKRSEEKRREVNPHAPSGAFDAFWAEYPRKKSKGQAMKAWRRLPAEQHPEIMHGLRVAIMSDDWRCENGKFIPYPGKWLNARGWEDEPTAPAERKFVV